MENKLYCGMISPVCGFVIPCHLLYSNIILQICFIESLDRSGREVQRNK